MDKQALLDMAASRKSWLKLLEPIDARDQKRWEIGEDPILLRFDNRPADVRAGHLLWCVDPDQLVIFALVEVLEDGDTALHDVAASATRWLFNVPGRVLVLTGRDDAPPLGTAGGAMVPFSYRQLTRLHAKHLAGALAATL